MNDRQKEVTQKSLKDEKKALDDLKRIYRQALDDINEKIAGLLAREDTENLQSIVYQVQYQNALKKQVGAILDALESEQFETVSEYLTECYENGYVGTAYDLHGQGVPIIAPIDQEQVKQALETDSKLSKPLYKALGENTTKLKSNVQRNLSRGLAQGASYAEITKLIARDMVGDYSKFNGGAFYFASRIARTEGHRVQNQAALDMQAKAKAAGADIVKQWDATLDGRTRTAHRWADGQIRELDEPFDVDGEKMDAPGVGGSARNVCNCRCALLQRFRGNLGEVELRTLEERAKFYGFDKSESLTEFKRKYLNASKNDDKVLSGAITGARNPFGDEAEEHAELYYESVRKMTTDIEKVSKASGYSKEQIRVIKNFIFMDKHDLGGDIPKRFAPDFMMAQSWQRLCEGKPEPHDLTLLRHEIMEKDLMEQGYSQAEAHSITSKKYNYGKEAEEFYAKIKKYKSRK